MSLQHAMWQALPAECLPGRSSSACCLMASVSGTKMRHRGAAPTSLVVWALFPDGNILTAPRISGRHSTREDHMSRYAAASLVAVLALAACADQATNPVPNRYPAAGAALAGTAADGLWRDVVTGETGPGS